MKKVLVTFATLFVLSALASSGLRLPAMSTAKADPNDWLMHAMHYVVQPHATPYPTGLSPTQIRTAYNLSLRVSQGTIAIVDAFDCPTVLDDLNVFSSQYGLPPVDGSNFEKHAFTYKVDPGWAMEISGCSIDPCNSSIRKDTIG
jgi:subtilase family serine protease